MPRQRKQLVRDEYMNWLLTPAPERDPKTKIAFSEFHDVTRTALHQWEREPEFQAKMREAMGRWGAVQYSEVMNRLMDIVAHGPDSTAVQASKVLLQHLDLRQEKGEDELTDETLESLRDALKKSGYAVINDEQ